MLIKPLLPYGLVELIRSYREFRRLGFSKFSAGRAVLSPGKLETLKSTRLNLLPTDSLSEIKYVVDVGANEGLWSLGLLSICQPEELLIIEPSPQLQPVLKSRFSNYPSVKILNVAAGPEKGVADFNIATHSHSSSILKPRAQMNNFYGYGYDVDQTVSVAVETLDDLLADLPEISLLKMDVQGYESLVLAGSYQTLKRTKHLIIEFNFYSHYEQDTLFAEIHSKLTDMGFYLSNLSPLFRLQNRCLWADALYRAHLTSFCDRLTTVDRPKSSFLRLFGLNKSLGKFSRWLSPLTKMVVM